MGVLCVDCDLVQEPGRALDGLVAAIQSFKSQHPLSSQWLVKTDLSPAEFGKHLQPHLHPGDRVRVMPVTDDGWSQGLDPWTRLWLRLALRPDSSRDVSAS